MLAGLFLLEDFLRCLVSLGCVLIFKKKIGIPGCGVGPVTAGGLAVSESHDFRGIIF
jgi:hypothetical protein